MVSYCGFGLHSNIGRSVSRFINKVLSDSRGWAEHGYTFVQVSPQKGAMLRKSKSNWRSVIHIRVSSNDTITHEMRLWWTIMR